MEYINKETLVTIETDSKLAGDWVPADQVKKNVGFQEEATDSQGDLTISQIKARLDELGVKYDKGAKKADLLALLEQHEG